jgi:hypothetical protein
VLYFQFTLHLRTIKKKCGSVTIFIFHINTVHTFYRKIYFFLSSVIFIRPPNGEIKQKSNEIELRDLFITRVSFCSKGIPLL